MNLAGIFQAIVLFVILNKRVKGFKGFGLENTFLKIVGSSLSAGAVMFILLKLLDRSAWDKKLSFLGQIGIGLPTTLDKFILDTHYTTNVIFLTLVVAGVGFVVYILLAYLLKIEELKIVYRALRRVPLSKFPLLDRWNHKGNETISTPPTNGT